MVIYLYYYQGYSTLEMAEILEKNPSTVRTWRHRQVEAERHLGGERVWKTVN